MKDAYAGDIGDYVKLALLRTLAADRTLSVAWYRTSDDATRNDGRHVGYLDDARERDWRHLDPDLYDQLRMMRGSEGGRTIAALQRILEAPGREFFDVLLDGPSGRAVWFARLTHWLARSDILFLDPDNGIASAGFSGSTKSVTLEEVSYLRDKARTVIIYHHQTRAKGGHVEEIEHIGRSLVDPYEYQAVCALRAKSWSPRAFLIISPDRELWARSQAFAAAWSPHVSFHPLSGAPDALGLTEGVSAWRRDDAADERRWAKIGRGEWDHLIYPENANGPNDRNQP